MSTDGYSSPPPAEDGSVSSRGSSAADFAYDVGRAPAVARMDERCCRAIFTLKATGDTLRVCGNGPSCSRREHKAPVKRGKIGYYETIVTGTYVDGLHESFISIEEYEHREMVTEYERRQGLLGASAAPGLGVEGFEDDAPVDTDADPDISPTEAAAYSMFTDSKPKAVVWDPNLTTTHPSSAESTPVLDEALAYFSGGEDLSSYSTEQQSAIRQIQELMAQAKLTPPSSSVSSPAKSVAASDARHASSSAPKAPPSMPAPTPARKPTRKPRLAQGGAAPAAPVARSIGQPRWYAVIHGRDEANMRGEVVTSLNIARGLVQNSCAAGQYMGMISEAEAQEYLTLALRVFGGTATAPAPAPPPVAAPAPVAPVTPPPAVVSPSTSLSGTAAAWTPMGPAGSAHPVMVTPSPVAHLPVPAPSVGAPSRYGATGLSPPPSHGYGATGLSPPPFESMAADPSTGTDNKLFRTDLMNGAELAKLLTPPGVPSELGADLMESAIDAVALPGNVTCDSSAVADGRDDVMGNALLALFHRTKKRSADVKSDLGWEGKSRTSLRDVTSLDVLHKRIQQLDSSIHMARQRMSAQTRSILEQGGADPVIASIWGTGGYLNRMIFDSMQNYANLHRHLFSSAGTTGDGWDYVAEELAHHTEKLHFIRTQQATRIQALAAIYCYLRDGQHKHWVTASLQAKRVRQLCIEGGPHSSQPGCCSKCGTVFLHGPDSATCLWKNLPNKMAKQKAAEFIKKMSAQAVGEAAEGTPDKK